MSIPQPIHLLNKEGSKWLTSHITNISKYKKKLTITNITNISTDQVVIEFAVSQMRLQLTKSVIFAGFCCFVSQLSTFHSEHYLLFSCKEKVKGRMTGFHQVTAFFTSNRPLKFATFWVQSWGQKCRFRGQLPFKFIQKLWKKIQG